MSITTSTYSEAGRVLGTSIKDTWTKPRGMGWGGGDGWGGEEWWWGGMEAIVLEQQ